MHFPCFDIAYSVVTVLIVDLTIRYSAISAIKLLPYVALLLAASTWMCESS